MSSTAARCDQILALIDACLAEVDVEAHAPTDAASAEERG